MATPLMDSCITIHSLYPNLIDADHDAIIESIEKEIQHFFTNEIVRNRYSNIVIVERKGLNLFHPYLHNVAGLHGLSSIKLHGDPGEFPQVAITKNYSLTRSTKNYVIITDAIDTGSEIKRIIYSYYPRLFHKPKISKVCGYLAKKDAITELEKEFPKIEFKFLNVVDNDDYQKKQEMILCVYQDRMEPIDEEHDFFFQNVNPCHSYEDIVERIQNVLIEKNKKFSIYDNPLVIRNKKCFTVYFEKTDELMNGCHHAKIDGTEIEKLALRFKYFPRYHKLRVEGIAMPHLKRELKKGILMRYIFRSCDRNLPIKICRSLRFPQRKKEIFREILCPYCVDKNISHCLLMEFIADFEAALK